MSFGLREIEYKLSLLIMPIIIGATPKFSKAITKRLLLAFVFSTIVSGLICIGYSLVETSFSYIQTYNELSLFLSPNYLSLYIDFCLLILFNQLSEKQSKSEVFLKLLGIIFLLFFNLLLTSKTGILIMIMILIYYAISYINKFSKKITIGIAIITLLLGTIGVKSNPRVMHRFSTATSALFTKKIDHDVSESSLVRILVWKEAIKIIQENPIFGVGTGDSKDSLLKRYEDNGIIHALERKYNAHNQYLEWLITLGIIGFIILEGSILYLLITSLRTQNILLTLFVIVNSIAFLTESILETQAGLLFFSFFSLFLLYHHSHKDSNKDKLSKISP
tara:strand:- start:1433 stop:2434 length:1002 start_codon:yes stop_codon:yes gene_type:complete